MQVKIEVLNGDGSLALTSLFRWLTRDPDVRRHVAVSFRPSTSKDTMGALDVINAILTQATSISTLAVSIAAWRDSRAKPPAIKVTAGERSVIISTDSTEIAAMLQSLQTPDVVDHNPPGRHDSTTDEGAAARRNESDEPA